jgi:hypothetical protein
MKMLKIDTGEIRSVSGHTVSGAIAAGTVAGAINYNRYKKDEISKNEALQNSAKLTLQGGIATGASIATANYIGKGSWLHALGALSIGIAGVYGIEKLSQKYNAKSVSNEDEKFLEQGEEDGE